MVKELSARMRGKRAFIILTLYLGGLTLVVSLVYLILLNSLRSGLGAMTNTNQLAGKMIFGVVAGMQLVSFTFIAPALTSGAVSAEREHQTFDLLRTTLLPMRAFILGKFFSALVFVFLLLFAALPLQSLAFLFGGVAPQELLIGMLILIVTAIHFCAIGLFFSSFLKSTLASTVLSYAFPILATFGLPFMLLILSSFIGSLLFGVAANPAMSSPPEQLLIFIGWVLVSLHPVATGVATELMLLDQANIWSYQLPLSNGTSMTLISPWIVFTLVTLLFSVLLLVWSTALARRKVKG
jgi:ABC-type transport system involved in multi-copper enzyme maturation permease subunit